MAATMDVLEEEIGRLRAGLVTGNLLEANTDRTQSLFGKAIRDHPGDLEGMKRACMAVFYHCEAPPPPPLPSILCPLSSILPSGLENFSKKHKEETPQYVWLRRIKPLLEVTYENGIKISKFVICKAIWIPDKYTIVNITEFLKNT